MLLASDSALILTLTTVITAASFELKIKPIGEKFVRANSQSILFTCEVTGVREGEVRIQWLDNSNKEISENSANRVYAELTDRFSKKLYIRNIQATDAGRYFCIATTSSGQETKSVELTQFKAITFDHVPNPRHPAINTDAVIECKVSSSPDPVISWRYNGITLETGKRYTKLKDGLRISNITRADNGNYTCRAEVEDEGRYDERRITVEVHIPPKVTEGPGVVEEVEGRDVSLSCKADGLPLPKFAFYKNQKEVLSNTDRIFVDADAGKITFRPLKKEDDGEYMCKANNDVGDDAKSGRLQVLVPPRIHEFHNITKSEHDTGTLTCRSGGHPSPEMGFQREGNRYPYQPGSNEGGRIHVTRKGSDGHLELIIRNLSPSDATNYTCLSKNSAGHTNKTAFIDVHFKPRFGEDNKKLVYSWAGARHNISCHVQAQPMPRIRWVRYSRALVNNETFVIFDSGRQSNLQVRIKESDQSWIYGDYVCQAENSKGTAEEHFQLNRATVPDKPQQVEEIEVTPNQVVLRVDPPRENGGVSIIGYRVEFENNVQDVSLSEPFGVQSDDIMPSRNWHRNASSNHYPGAEVSVDNLRPGTKYVFRIRAKNEVGVGSSLEKMVITANLTNPYPIKLTSPKLSSSAREYHITWAAPKTGGRPIKSYDFRYKKVRNSGEELTDLRLDDWNSETKYDNPDHPIREYRLRKLNPMTDYQLQVIARNELGVSIPNENFFFSTSDVEQGHVGSRAGIAFSGLFVSSYHLIGPLSLVISTFTTKWIVEHAKI